jgi:ABC-2 type transport system permease protein
MMAAAYADYLIYEFGAAMTGNQGPLKLEAQTIGRVASLNAFELYVPALKEKDKGTLVRLRISNMTTFEWLSAVSASQLIIGLLALALTFLTAVALGYRSSGSLLAVTVVGLLSCMAIVAISVLVAAYTRTIFDLVTIGCFPFFILMFFSGGMFPLPDVSLFAVGGRAVNLNEVLPTTHTITAFSKILHSGSGLVEVVPELGAIAALTVTFLAVGTWVFTRRHMRAV